VQSRTVDYSTGDRFVIPVKAPQKDAIPGIIHDTSNGTLYVEPNAVVPLGNQLRAVVKRASGVRSNSPGNNRAGSEAGFRAVVSDRNHFGSGMCAPVIALAGSQSAPIHRSVGETITCGSCVIPPRGRQGAASSSN